MPVVAVAVKGAKESDSNTLPEDLRYSADTLRRLFLRPRTRVTLRQSHYYRSSGVAGDASDMGGEDDDEGGDCCAMEEAPEDWGPPSDVPLPEPAGLGLLEAPRRAQVSVTARNRALPAEGGCKIDHTLTLPRTRTPKPKQKIEISYARTAKKVDIKALKDDLWDTIDAINPAQKKTRKDLATTEVECILREREREREREAWRPPRWSAYSLTHSHTLCLSIPLGC